MIIKIDTEKWATPSQYAQLIKVTHLLTGGAISIKRISNNPSTSG